MHTLQRTAVATRRLRTHSTALHLKSAWLEKYGEEKRSAAGQTNTPPQNHKDEWLTKYANPKGNRATAGIRGTDIEAWHAKFTQAVGTKTTLDVNNDAAIEMSTSISSDREAWLRKFGSGKSSVHSHFSKRPSSEEEAHAAWLLEHSVGSANSETSRRLSSEDDPRATWLRKHSAGSSTHNTSEDSPRVQRARSAADAHAEWLRDNNVSADGKPGAFRTFAFTVVCLLDT